MTDEDSDVLLLLADAFVKQGEGLHEARREVFRLLVEEAWKVAMRSRHYLTTQCLDTPCDSAWMVLYKYGTDINFLNATSLTRSSFHILLRRFSGYYYIPRAQSAQAALLPSGSMELGSLCMMFAVPPSTLARTLRRAEEALSTALNNFYPARISWPSPTRQNELAKLVEAREPLLKHTFGFIDGKNFKVQQPSNADLQNAMYNGWLHSVFVTAKGRIGVVPRPRTVMLAPVYCPDSRKNVVSDSAFPCSTMMTGRILTPLKDGDLERLLPSVRRSARTLHNAITSVRQAAEWGVGSVQKVYARLNLPLPYDPELRGLRLNNLFRMANYRVRTVGISQIRTTFSGEMELPANLYC